MSAKENDHQKLRLSMLDIKIFTTSDIDIQLEQLEWRLKKAFFFDLSLYRVVSTQYKKFIKRSECRRVRLNLIFTTEDDASSFQSSNYSYSTYHLQFVAKNLLVCASQASVRIYIYVRDYCSTH